MAIKFSPGRRFMFLGFVIVALALAMSLLAVVRWRTDHMATDRVGKRIPGAPIVGHLGGQPVAIPVEYANFLDYDGDPHFMTPRDGPQPVRTVKSGIRGFGFDISYARLMSKDGVKPGAGSANEEESRPDLHIGIKSNTYYLGDEQAVLLTDSISTRLGEPYTRQEKDVYGLEFYAPAATPSKRPVQAQNIYIHRNRNGVADVYIRCARPEGRVCVLYYSLSPALKASVVLQFPRHLLSEWEALQSATSLAILGFRTPQ